METKESRTGRSGRGDVSGRSSPGSKLKTETGARKAAGRKLQTEKASQVSVGEKLRHDKAVFEEASDAVGKGQNAVKGVETGRSHGRKTPSSQRAVTLVSVTAHARLDEDTDDNAGDRDDGRSDDNCSYIHFVSSLVHQSGKSEKCN